MTQPQKMSYKDFGDGTSRLYHEIAKFLDKHMDKVMPLLIMWLVAVPLISKVIEAIIEYNKLIIK